LKPKSCTGQCFAAGTLVRGVVALTPIEALTCGLRVVSYVAGERIDVEPLPLVIDPLTWRAVTLVVVEPGYRLDAKLLRPLDWLHGRGVGASVWLDLPHVGVRGFATLVEIAACPPVETDANGRLITGTFRHNAGEVWDLVVEGESKPIGGTAAHPVWSEDRRDWVPLGQLRIGERVRVLGGTKLVQVVTLRPGIEPVYNIEVEGDHCYRVGQQGLLVHNASIREHIIVGGGPGFDYAQAAVSGRLRVTQGRPRPGLRRGESNAGALRYRTTGEESLYYPGMSRSNIMVLFAYGPNPVDHPDQQLLIRLADALGVRRAKCTSISEFFTERTPCSSCSSAIPNLLNRFEDDHPDVTLYFVIRWGQSDMDLVDKYREWGLWNI
jgi:hypothetical protein